ncbi:MAG: hypothetical protein LBF05_06680 [Tannerella sp.]|jgi:hypothetical protein|nr:hypothetical protein [Tannerella sp.]
MSKKIKTEENGNVLIANPIYDHVFKYLMEDSRVARKFISAIIGEEVVELVFAPQEYVRKLENVSEKSWSFYRLDFNARIRIGDVYKSVMIEMQKVSLHTDIMRFRRYMGGQYQKPENSYVDSSGVEHPMQIYCIYFIGSGIGVKGVPVMTVNPCASDAGTGRALKGLRNEFVESLHHRSWIVQVPELKGRRRNDLEILLSIFDQANRMNDCHILNLNVERFPDEYRPIVRRLQLAAADREIREAMEIEDDVTEHFRIEERIRRIKLEEKDMIIAEKEAALARERAEKEEKEAALAEKEAAFARERAEKEAALARERAEKEALLAELATLKAHSQTGKK